MCVTSMVMDRWNPYVPQPTSPWPPVQPVVPTTNPNIPTIITIPQVAEGVDNEIVKELIATLRQALDAAEKFDKLTGQPDCVDPEKEKLMDRVEELERRLEELEDQHQTEIRKGQ